MSISGNQQVRSAGIVGAGIAGLASAIRLAAQGYEVDVYEANSYPGGKLSQFSIGEYRFDAGPSLFTMPAYVEELDRIANVDSVPPFRYRQLEHVCHYFWEDGTRLEADADPEAFARTVEDVLGVPAERVRKALADAQRKYELTGRTFLEKSLHRWQTWLTRSVARAMLHLPRLDIFRSMNQVNERNLQHPKLVQLFNRFATYNGSDPYRATGLLNIIPHFEHGIGTFFPEGGMYAITEHLVALAEALGVRIHYQERVDRIRHQNGRVTGLEIGQEFKPFDLVVSNMDVFFTYRRLLPDAPQPERMLRQEKSTSALIFYWGIDRSFPELDLHNIFFSENYREEFACLTRGEVYEDPTVYVNISSKYAPEDAPSGAENWFVMVNVPYDNGQDWDALIPRIRKQALAKVSRILGTDIASHIAVEDLLEPRTIESKTASHLGALYGTASNDRMAAFLRHPNFSGKLRNLYFCGGSVHPGGGIPLCLLSARIVSETISRTHGHAQSRVGAAK